MWVHGIGHVQAGYDRQKYAAGKAVEWGECQECGDSDGYNDEVPLFRRGDLLVCAGCADVREAPPCPRCGESLLAEPNGNHCDQCGWDEEEGTPSERGVPVLRCAGPSGLKGRRR